MCSISTFKNKINYITQPLNQLIMRKCGVQSTKFLCCNRFSFLLSIYDANIFNDRINILEYPEFVIIRKEFRFRMEIFYLGVNKFKYIENYFSFDKCFVGQFLEAIMNREPTEFLYNLGIQYIIGNLLSLLPLESLRRVLYFKLSSIISS